MRAAQASLSVFGHIAKSYGGLPGVWVGFLAAATSYVLLYGMLAVSVTELLLAALGRAPADAGSLAAKSFLILAASAVLALLGNYAFVKSTDLRYSHLVGSYYLTVAFAPSSKLQAERIDKVKNLFRDHMDGTIGVLRILRDDVLRVVLACFVPAIYLATYDPLVGSLVAAIAAVQAWVALSAARHVASLRRRALAAYSFLSRRMFDALRNAALLRIADATDRKWVELNKLAGEEAEVFWSRHRAFFMFEFGKALLTAGCFAAVLWIAGTRYNDTPEAAYLVVLTAMYLLQAMHSASSSADIAPRLQEKWSNVRESIALLDRLSHSSLVDRTSSNRTPGNSNRADVVIEDLTFSHTLDEGERAVLKSVSMRIPSGAHVAIIGSNGSGKTTLLRLILGLEHAQAGRVLVGGHDLGSLTDSERARLVSWLPASGPVIDGTVEENLRLFSPGATDEAIWTAIRVSGLDQILGDLSSGLTTSVGDGGSSLSDGQRARLALARCLLRDSALYLLDEPMAAIDHDSAASILSAVLNHLNQRTVLAVVHSEALLSDFPYVIRCADKSLHWVRRPSA